MKQKSMLLNNVFKVIFFTLLFSASKLGARDAAELQQAILADSASMVEKALHAGATISTEINGFPPLQYAVLLKKPNAIGALLDAGAKVAYVDLKNVLETYNPLAGQKFLERLKSLTPDQVDEAMILARRNYGSLTYHELNPTVSPIIPEDRLKSELASTFSIFENLLKRGYDLSKVWVSQGGPDSNIFIGTKGLQYFLEKGANPNAIVSVGKETWTPLLVATQAARNDYIDKILAAGAKINLAARPFGNELLTPLGYAMKKNYHNTVEYLVSLGGSLKPDVVPIKPQKPLQELLVEELSKAFVHVADQAKAITDQNELRKKLNQAVIDLAKSIKALFQRQSSD